MKMTIRMRITLLTGIVIIIASALLTFSSIYTAENKIQQVVNQAAAVTLEIQATKIEASSLYPIQNMDKSMVLSFPIQPVDLKALEPLPQSTVESTPAKAVDMTMLTSAYAVPAQVASREFNYISLGVMGVITLAGMLISYYLAGKALKPVHQLNEAVLNISENNLKERISENNKNDEISSLTCSFNAMLERLEESFWRQKRFSSNVAHELKTPLATMKTSLQVLNMGEEPTVAEYKEAVDIAEKNIIRLTNLVDDMLVLTNEGYKDENVKISINELLSDIVQELDPLFEKHQIKTELLIGAESICIQGNEALTYRLFYNLVENAIKYNNANGKIVISTMELLNEAGENVCITVEDTGVGINESELKKIFEPFYCVNPSRSRKLGGAGLGLSIVKDIADRYGWKIKVQSAQGTAAGTAFQVMIPVFA